MNALGKTIINYGYLPRLVGPLGGLGEMSWAPEFFEEDDPHYESKVHALIDQHTVPSFHRWDEENRRAAKRVLAYMLTFDPDQADRELNGYRLPFERRDAGEFFEWVWEALFPGEDWSLVGEPADYTVIYDPDIAIEHRDA